MGDPIYEQDGKFYFYDETGDGMGPYRSRDRARRALKAYIRWLNHGPTWWQGYIYWPIRYNLVPRIRHIVVPYLRFCRDCVTAIRRIR